MTPDDFDSPEAWSDYCDDMAEARQMDIDAILDAEADLERFIALTTTKEN